jgi:modulator of FtsH protease
VLTGAYQTFLTAVAGAGAALTGLLFVALSVTPRNRAATYPIVIREVRAAAALAAFTSVLSISLFGLVPGTNAGYPAVASGAIGLLFTVAGLRSILASPETTFGHIRRQASLIALLLCAFGFDIDAGVRLLADPHSSGGAETLGYVLVALLLIGITRAWELVGDRDTGILASITVLAGREQRDDREDSAGQSGTGAGPALQVGVL